MIFGEITNVEIKSLKDLETHEKVMMFPLILLVLFLGIYPSAITDIIGPSVDKLLSIPQFTKN